MPVGILRPELAKTVRCVVDRVVDGRATVLQLCVDRIRVVDADVQVPNFVDELPVGDDRARVSA